jgi:hypothetical protein
MTMLQTAAILVALGVTPVQELQAPRVHELRPFARVAHPPIAEQSGIVRSRKFDDVYWVHNDSGHAARLFAVRRDGGVVVPRGVDAAAFGGIVVANAKNVDWEDIAIDGDTLYIGDVGNNRNRRRDLGVYVLREPDPRVAREVRPTEFLPIAYPDQKEFPPKDRFHFDCEAIFFLRGKLYFITKHRLGTTPLPSTSATLYRLDTRHTDRPNVLTRTDARNDLFGWVTGADVSPDGRTLAVLTHAPVSSVWLFPTDAAGDRFLSAPSRKLVFTGGGQVEGIAFDGNDTLIVTNEARDMFEVKVREFR